jgi:hypothetical protein
VIVTPLPSPGVYAQHNAVDTPALLPDGSPSELSVNATLRLHDDARNVRPLPVPLPRVTVNGRNGSGGPSSDQPEEVEA